MTYLKYQNSTILLLIVFISLYIFFSAFSSAENTALRLMIAAAMTAIVYLGARVLQADKPATAQVNIEAVPGLAWLAGRNGRINSMNARMKTYLNVADGAISVARDAIHPEDRNKTMDLWSQRSAVEMRNTHRLMGPDGRYHWFRSIVQPLHDEYSNIIGWCGTFVDIDDQKRAEEVLRSNEENLRLILDNIPGQIVTADANGDNDYSNPNSERFYGASFHEVNASGFKQFIHPDDIEEFDAERMRCIEKAIPMDHTCRLLRHDGVYRWFRMRVNPALDEHGKVVRWYGLHSDIDEEVKALEKLRAAQDKLSQASHFAGLAEVSASTAHELKQPLAAVVTNSHACQSWLAIDPPNLERARTSAERIVRDAMEASEVVNRIRDLFAQKELKKDLIDINEVIDDVARLVRTKHGGRGLTVSLGLDKGLTLVPADRIQLQQVLYNLARNGIEAMQSNGEDPMILHIRSCLGDDTVRVEMRDTGAGLADPHQIFEPFFTTKQDGMGMGLSICRSILDAHKGKIWAEGLGSRGALFVFELPLLSEAGQGDSGSGTSHAGAEAEQVR